MRKPCASAVASAVALALGLGTTSCSAPYRNSDGEVTAVTRLKAHELRSGDCFDDPPDPATRIDEVLALPCAEPHDNQVFTIEQHEATPTDSYPGAGELDLYARTACAATFQQEVQRREALDFSAVVPSASSWERGDRSIVCLLWNRDFYKLDGSELQPDLEG